MMPTFSVPTSLPFFSIHALLETKVAVAAAVYFQTASGIFIVTVSS